MVELHLLCPESTVEWVSDALDELDALSVSVEDADAGTDAEQPLFGEPGMPVPQQAWGLSRLRALFPDDAAARHAAHVLAVQDFFEGCHDLGVVQVPDEDWVRLTQSQFQPVEVTPVFWIVPTWHAVPAAATKVVRLDPGLAFGTGTHPTTRMCLKWIAGHEGALGSVLDYGCGSGILAIGAALHGATPVHAVDIDPDSVFATQTNAVANRVELTAALPDIEPQTYTTVIANILASPLKVLAPLLVSRMSNGGHLILAGILDRQEQELKDAYAPWIRLEVADTTDGWILMTGVRAA
jgi:ribosomal protein L11 methyltransferase